MRISRYQIRDYQKGFESDQVRIGLEVAQKWIWPFAYHMEGLLRVHAQSDFDPETRHYCFLENKMVGYMFSLISPDGTGLTATLDFPRFMPGHEEAAEILIEKAFETLKKKGVSRVLGRVTTMCPDDIKLAEKMGFSLFDWGYKVYYCYEMGWGKLKISEDPAVEVDPAHDLDECAELASRWYKRPKEWCLSTLEEWHEEGIITHSGVRENGNLISACMAARNDVRQSTAAIYYIYTPNEVCLKPMLARVVRKCIDHQVHDVIADLINEHREFESVYQELGFHKVAEWARCERKL